MTTKRQRSTLMRAIVLLNKKTNEQAIRSVSHTYVNDVYGEANEADFYKVLSDLEEDKLLYLNSQLYLDSGGRLYADTKPVAISSKPVLMVYLVRPSIKVLWTKEK
jgi:hypothetical protein